jgi:hypothetical protein
LPFEVSVSGTAPFPASGQQDASAGQAQGQDQVNGRDSGVAIQTMPNRLDSLKWILIGGLGALFALGMVFVWRRPVVVASNDVAAVAVSAVRPREQRNKLNASATAQPGEPAQMAATAVAVEVDRSLDQLKDKLFRLELRRQAGTISEEEYARERGRTEEILRELLRG